MSFPGFILGSASFAESTAFDEFFNDTQQSTTSNGWVTYDTFTTPEAKEPGIYRLDWAVEMGQSKKQKRVGLLIEAREGTSGAFTEFYDERVALGDDNIFTGVTFFKVFEIVSEDVFQIRVRFGQTSDGGTGRIRNVNIVLFKVGEAP